MAEKITEDIFLERYAAYYVKFENDNQDIGYVFEFDIESARVGRRLKNYALKRKNAKDSDMGLVNMIGTIMTKGELRAQRNIKFMDMTLKQQAFIRMVLKDSFTENEMEIMGKGGLIVRVTSIEERMIGSYYRKHHYADIPQINLDPESDEDTITHEFVHHARTVDTSRTGFAKTAYLTVNGIFDETFQRRNESDIQNFEEAATVAETTARTKGPAEKVSGYYDYVTGIFRRTAYESDRKRLTGNSQSANIKETKGVKGKAAINRINEEFTKTHIASMSMNGRTALRSYDVLINNIKY